MRAVERSRIPYVVLAFLSSEQKTAPASKPLSLLAWRNCCSGKKLIDFRNTKPRDSHWAGPGLLRNTYCVRFLLCKNSGHATAQAPQMPATYRPSFQSAPIAILERVALIEHLLYTAIAQSCPHKSFAFCSPALRISGNLDQPACSQCSGKHVEASREHDEENHKTHGGTKCSAYP